MKLEELTAYAEEKYHISEEHKWMDFPGFSVLASLESAAEETEALVKKAWTLLNSPDLPRNEYTRYIFGKCAPVFEHYGALDWAEELRRAAER